MPAEPTDPSSAPEPEPDGPRRAAEAAQARFWNDIAVNEAESHVAALRRDQLLAMRRAAMERLSAAQRSMTAAREADDQPALARAIEHVARAARDYKRVRDEVAAELQDMISARMTRMAGLAEQLGDAAEAHRAWLSALELGAAEPEPGEDA